MKWGVRRNRRKAANARESAKEWDEIAADEKSRGNAKKASRYSRYAARDRADADRYDAKADKIHNKDVQSRSRSAAKTYFRQQTANTFRGYRNQGRKLDLKVTNLDEKHVNEGRYQVARGRAIRRQTVSTLLCAYAGIQVADIANAFMSNPTAFKSAAAGTAAAVVMGANFVSGGRYYSQQAKRYRD